MGHTGMTSVIPSLISLGTSLVIPRGYRYTLGCIAMHRCRCRPYPHRGEAQTDDGLDQIPKHLGRGPARTPQQ